MATDFRKLMVKNKKHKDPVPIASHDTSNGVLFFNLATFGRRCMQRNSLYRTYRENVFQNLLQASYKKILPTALVLFASGCSSDARNLRLEIISASNKSKADKISLNVSNILGKKIKKICVQGDEYLMKETFVELTKMDAPGYQDIIAGEFILWVFLEAGAPIQVKFQKREVMPPEGRSSCTESSLIYVVQEVIVFN